MAAKQHTNDQPLPEPDPPPPRLRSQVFTTGRPTSYGPALCCPRCGMATLTFLGVLLFDRAPDGRQISFLRVQDLVEGGPILPLRSSQPTREPFDKRYRWHGVNIEFGCDACHSIFESSERDSVGHGIWLEVFEYDAGCVMHWVYDPLPEGYETSKPKLLEGPDARDRPHPG